MANVFDVANYILKKKGPTLTWKLQRLVYYTQAWHLAWEETPLFDEDFEAWANGPASRDLYDQHVGKYELNPGEFEGGDEEALTDGEKDTVDIVLKHYGDKESFELSGIACWERPWHEARKGLKPGERGKVPIDKDTMLDFYSGLIRDKNACDL